MSRKKDASRSTKKRRYRAPVLRKYGDLKALALTKGGAMNDAGGMPKTRMAATGA